MGKFPRNLSIFFAFSLYFIEEELTVAMLARSQCEVTRILKSIEIVFENGVQYCFVFKNPTQYVVAALNILELFDDFFV